MMMVQMSDSAPCAFCCGAGDPQAALGFLRGVILSALADVPDKCWGLGLTSLSGRICLPDDVVRGLLHDLRRNGLVEYRRGGRAYGGDGYASGYALTAKGMAYAGAD